MNSPAHPAEPARAAPARAVRRAGRPERHPRLVLRRRPLPRPRRRGRHGIAMHAAGADLVDVGGESTRPGAGRVDAAEELRRVLPVIRDLVAEGVPVSIDTTRAAVAEAALEAGATVVNDVSGGLADPAMARGRRAGPRAVDPHALARPQRPDAAAGRLRGRARRGAGRAGGAGGRRGAGRRRPGPDRARPGPGVRQDGRAQLGAAAAAGRAARARVPGAGRGVPQAVPRRAAGRRRRCAPPAGRPRGGHRGDHGAGGRGGRLGGAGARRRVVHGRGGGRGGDAAGRGPGARPGRGTEP